MSAVDLTNVGEWYLPGDRAAQRLSFPLLTEQLELLKLLGTQRVAVARLVVMRRQLIEQLLDAVLLAERVDIRYFVLTYGGKILVYLIRFKTRRHPGVLLERTPAVVIVRCGLPRRRYKTIDTGSGRLSLHLSARVDNHGM